ncbi:MAG: siderophore-interacting protein [Spongiibacteraceae bacterium]|nr:siderophore-interacting protein [Spongiibacteraceae bacterium]
MNNSTGNKQTSSRGAPQYRVRGGGRRRSPPRLLTVIRSVQLTPHMHRITLGGDDMAGFPEGRESANFKLHVPLPGQQSIVRTYTVRNFNPEKQEVDVDFFVHNDPGPASSWAINASPGDKIGFAGPGPDKLTDFSKDWFLFAGDMSALPAIGANIEQLPADAKGYAVLEIVKAEDKQDLPFPAGIEVHWILNPHPEQKNTCLIDAVMPLKWLPGKPAVWIASESSTVRALRKQLSEKHGLGRDGRYCSGYWQIGLSEDQHQIEKRKDKD